MINKNLIFNDFFSVVSAADPIKEHVLHRATSIQDAAEKVLAELKKENRTAEGSELTKEVAALTKLIAELKADTDSHKIHLHEAEITQLERRVQTEIRRISHHPTNDLRHQLLQRATALEKLAQDGVTSLKAKNQTAEISTIEKEVESLKKLASELAHATTHEQLTKLEQEVSRAEQVLAAELTKAHIIHHRQRRDSPSDLVGNSAKILTEVRSIISKLKGEGKHEAAKVFEKIEEVVVDVESQAQNLHPHTVIGKLVLKGLEDMLKVVEHRLDAEVKKLAAQDGAATSAY